MENNVWEVQFDIEQYKGLARRVISESHGKLLVMYFFCKLMGLNYIVVL